VIKLRALEETDKGLPSNLSVTTFDRLGIILNTVEAALLRERYQNGTRARRYRHRAVGRQWSQPGCW